jgi:hypothetical protein
MNVRQALLVALLALTGLPVFCADEPSMIPIGLAIRYDA